MRIAVLRGGPSRHYETSLKTGEQILGMLREEPEKYKPVDVFISKDGEWHVSGRRYEPQRVLAHVDLVWNAMHGEFGEDGRLAQLLNGVHMPYTGSSSLGLALSLNKDLAKRAYALHGIEAPRHEVFSGDASVDDLVRVFRSFLHPVVVKPVQSRGKLGVRMAHSFDELKVAVAAAFEHGERVMVEEFIRGANVSCGVIEGFRGEKLYSLIPMPNEFKPETHKRISWIAKKAHEALGLRHYSSSEFVVTPKDKIYILETVALPTLEPDSSMRASLSGVGLSHKDFVEHIISLAKR